MKKYLFLAVAATAMFASCSNDEVVEMNPQNAIGFSTFVDKSTRATDITSDNLTAFKVWGYQGTTAIFDGDEVSKTITNNDLSQDWRYENTRYWVEGQAYKFYAFAPAITTTGDSYSYTGTGSDNTGISFTNGAGQTDLLYADASVESADANQGIVAFTFSHLLSRVRIKFDGAFANDAMKVKVTDLKITGIVSKCTYDGTAWTASATNTDKADYTFPITTDAFTDATSEHLYFIPNTQDITISFNVQGFQGDAALTGINAKSVTATEVEMAANNSYEFVITLNDQNILDEDETLNPIEFTVEKIDGFAESWTSNNMTLENSTVGD